MKKIIAILLAALMLLSLTACQSSDYKKAVSLKANGDYAAAADLFEKLKDYQDSSAQLSDCRYSLARIDYENGDYADAAEKFLALGDYKDSASYYTRSTDSLLRAELLGTWTCEMDITELMTESILEGMGEDAIEMELKDIVCTAVLTFNEKGTVEYTIDADSYKTAIDSTLDQTVEAIYVYYESALEKELTAAGYTMEQLFKELKVDNVRDAVDAMMGMSVRDLMEMFLPDDLTDAANLTQNGVYSVENGGIVITMGAEDTEATLVDGELTVLDPDGPQTFTKD